MDDKTTEVDGKDAHVLNLDTDWPLADQVHGAAADGPGNAHAPGAPPGRTPPPSPSKTEDPDTGGGGRRLPRPERGYPRMCTLASELIWRP